MSTEVRAPSSPLALLNDAELLHRIGTALDTLGAIARHPHEHREAAWAWVALQEIIIRLEDRGR
jgi:hypothetical protein